MSPQFQMVHRPSLLPTTDRCLSVWCRFASDDLWNAVVSFQPNRFPYRKDLGTCDALLCVSDALQGALESGQEARIVEIDFSAAFDRVNHKGILYKFCSESIIGSVLYILTQFLSNRLQHVMVDGCRSKLVNVVSAVPQGSVLSQLLFLLYTSDIHLFLLYTFFYSGEQADRLCRWLYFDICCAIARR